MINKNCLSVENEELNEVIIYNDVLQSIASHSVKELKGVELINSIVDGIVEKIVKKGGNKAIRIENQEEDINLEVHVAIEHGLKISEICTKLQALIKKDIEEMTEIKISKINIFVDNIIVEDKSKEITDLKEQEK